MKRLFAVFACALAFGAPTSALAQFTGDQDLTHGWELRLGGFVAEKKASRNKGGDLWLAIGAERAFYETENLRTTLSIDYYGAQNIYSVPLCFNVRSTNADGLHVGAGVGLSLGHDIDSGMSALAYNLLLGYMTSAGTNPITVDLRYLGTNASHQELNGWSLTVGYRF
ncbi:MAG: hypothetical protein HUU17_04835 [Chthonomonadales bacterium]|nr:hypothetical protein [Chthonomonadales bacterium]